MTETDLAMRLEHLERDNKRLKGLVVTILIFAAAFATIGATQQAPEKITAREFDLVDSKGRVRVTIGNLFVEGVECPVIFVSDAKGGTRLMVTEHRGVPSLSLYGTNNPIPGVSVVADTSGRPSVELDDAEGFSMQLGSTSTVKTTTGEKRETSAASITMFGNDEKHRVIWQAP